MQRAQKPEEQTHQTRWLKVPDQTSPFASEKLIWKFHFFKGHWSCKPRFIYTLGQPSGPPCGAGRGKRVALVLPSSCTGGQQKEKQNQREVLCEARTRLSLLLDTTNQISISTNPPEKVPYKLYHPTALCLVSPHSPSLQLSSARPHGPFAVLVTEGGEKQLSFILPNKSTENVFLCLFSFPPPEAVPCCVWSLFEVMSRRKVN